MVTLCPAYNPNGLKSIGLLLQKTLRASIHKTTAAEKHESKRPGQEQPGAATECLSGQTEPKSVQPAERASRQEQGHLHLPATTGPTQPETETVLVAERGAPPLKTRVLPAESP